MGPILCLCTGYSLGSAPMNAKMLTEQFLARGYPAEAWYMINVTSDLDDAEFVRIFRKRTLPAHQWPKMLAELHGEMVRARPAAVIGFHPLANITGALAARKVGAAFVGTQRNPAASQNKLLAFVEKRLGSSAHYRSNIAVSATVAASYRHYPAKYVRRMEVIHNALPALPSIEEDPRNARKALGLPEDVFLLGSLGRLTDQKNVEHLIDVLALVPDCKLAIAGEGPNEGAIREKIQDLGLTDRVIMLGPLRGRNVALLYRAIDIFMMPSRYEGFGNTLVEALSLGTITIATELPVIWEVSRGAAVLAPLVRYHWANAVSMLRNASREELEERRSLSRAVGTSYAVDSMVDAYLVSAGLPPWRLSDNP